jgi:hypothetical protein
MYPYRGRAAVDGQLVAGAQPAAVVHSIDDTRDSGLTCILYRTAILETIGQRLVTIMAISIGVSGAH